MPVVPTDSPVIVAQGSDATIRVADVMVDGVPVASFAGWSFRAAIRPYRTAPDTYYSFPPEDISTDAPDVLLSLPAEITAAFPWYYAVYDVEADLPGGGTQRIAQGSFQLHPEVTV